MAAIDFPASPAINDTFTSGNQTWKWNGITWNLLTGTVVNSVSGTTNEITVSPTTGAVVVSLPTNLVKSGTGYLRVTNTGVSSAAASLSRLEMGVVSGAPRIIFEDSGSATIWNIDNFGGALRMFNSGNVRFNLNAAGDLSSLNSVSAGTLISTVANGTAPLNVTSATKVNNLNASFVNGFAPEYCRVRNSASISLTHTVVTTLTFDTEDSDSSGAMHSTVTNTGRINFPTAGTYCIMLNVRFAGNAIGFREISITNSAGTTIAASRSPATTFSTLDDAANTYALPATAPDMRLFVSTIHTVSANDWVEATAYQNSGGALDAQAIGNFSPCFSAFRIA